MTKYRRNFLEHNEIYNADYFKFVDTHATKSARIISNSIIDDFEPKSVIDIGCGTGALLKSLQEFGCESLGLEYADEAINYCRSRGIRTIKFNIQKDNFKENRKYDLAISMEVAEHLPKKSANRYIRLLTSLAEDVVITAAPPGQGGIDHVNEQNPTYWEQKFQGYGYVINDELSQKWRNNWIESGKVSEWYYRNLMIFRKESGSADNILVNKISGKKGTRGSK